MQLTKPNIRTAIRYTWLDVLDWFDRHNTNLIGLSVAGVLTIVLVGTIARTNTAPAVVPALASTPSLPVIVIRKEVAPAPAPEMAAPDMALRQELEQLRQRVQELEAQQAAPAAPVEQPAPVVIYQAVESAPEMPAPAPAYAPLPSYQVDSAPPANEPPAQAPEQVPAPAQAPEQAQPTAAPTEAPKAGIFFQQTKTQIELQALAWEMEHCINPDDPTTCHQ